LLSDCGDGTTKDEMGLISIMEINKPNIMKVLKECNFLGLIMIE
jgi:hypothetical protein